MENYWVTIPAGEFQMGSENGDSDELPVHTVYLNSYQIGKYEVTNRQYAQCIKANICTGNTFLVDKDLHPVVNINWYDAKLFCTWVGGLLPTEAEWEKAASWNVETRTKYIYPWGNDEPTFALLNFNADSTKPVGNYPSGENGLFDMAGNVYEWTRDWYDSNYYTNSPDRHPVGPEAGVFKVLRGGAYGNGAIVIRSSSRVNEYPSVSGRHIGFRCVRYPLTFP